MNTLLSPLQKFWKKGDKLLLLLCLLSSAYGVALIFSGSVLFILLLLTPLGSNGWTRSYCSFVNSQRFIPLLSHICSFCATFIF